MIEPTYIVTIHDGKLVETHRRLSALERNRLVDFAFRHGLRYSWSETAARPERRSYR